MTLLTTCLLKLGAMFAMYAQAQAGQAPELPQMSQPPVREQGLASWYGNGDFHGTMTANGETFDPSQSTCAHRTLPFDTVVLIENHANGLKTWCRINDRGPYGTVGEDGNWRIELASDADVQWRGILDMSIRVSTLLQTQQTGLQHVSLRYWNKVPRRSFDLAVWSANW